MRTKIQKLLLPRPKDNRPSVPGFPNLIRGSAPRDGDCFFHSVAGLAEATVRHHTQGEPDPVSMRRRIARNMIEEFQVHNVVQLQTSELQGQRQEPNSGPLHTAHGITTDPQGLYARLSDNSSLRQFPPVPDDNDPVWLTWLGSKLAVEQFKTLTPVQKGHVLNMATKGSFNNETADELPALTASAFPGLKIDVYVGYTADTTGTLSFFTSPDPDASKVQAMARVFLANAHYEPVFEKT